MKKYLIIIILLVPFFMVGISNAVTVTPTSDAVTLINSIIGSGIQVVPGTETFVGGTVDPNVSAGTFSNAQSQISIDSGIILSSGKAADAVGPNTNCGVNEVIGGLGSGDDTTTRLQIPGDPDLSALSGYSTYDATVLEFDFVTAVKGDLTFNFVFASEEYIDYVGTSFNDVFGFFVDGVNIGLVPGTSDPITVNVINPNINSAYFNQNISVLPAPPGPCPYDIEYDGFTTVIAAQLLELAPGTHHMKLAVADSSDYILDATVFVEAGSFKLAQIEVPVDIKPTSCPNPINFKSEAVLPFAILGTVDFDVTQIDPESVVLQGVKPLRWHYEDVSTPYEPYIGKQDCYDCTTAGQDGYLDLVFHASTNEIVAAMGDSWKDGECAILKLEGTLKEEFGSVTIVGEDVTKLVIKKSKK